MKNTKNKIKNLLITDISKGSVETLSKLPYKVKDINDIHFLKMISLSDDNELPITKKVSFILYRNDPARDFLKIKVTFLVDCGNNNVTEEDMHVFIMNQLTSTGSLHLYVNNIIESFIKYFR